MIYRNGKKISALFRNGKDIKQAFRNGKLVWQKARPEEGTKRVKSITISIPAWGNVERIYWLSAFRAINEKQIGCYVDALISGVGIRLDGNGGKYKGEVSGREIIFPSNLLVNTEDVYVGMNVKVTAKYPSITQKSSSKSSTRAYFHGAALIPASSITLKRNSVPALTSIRGVRANVYSTLTGSVSPTAKALFKTAKSTKTTYSFKYSSQDIKTMETYRGTSTVFEPSFYVDFSHDARFKDITLTIPAWTHTFNLKITKITTY